MSLESLWSSSPLLHVLCVDRDPSIPMLGTKPEDTIRPFHFSLPLDFDRTSNESFLFSRIPVSGLFYLLGRPHPSQDLLSRPCPSQDLPGFPSKDLLPCWCKSHSWLKSGSSSFFTFFFLFLSFWTFRPPWSFLTSWVEPSFVKARGLSLHFYEIGFLIKFSPQQSEILFS